MPLEDVSAGEEGDDGYQGEEVACVEESLCTVPVAVDDVAKEEEVEKLECLVDGAVHHEVRLVPLAKGMWHIEREVGEEGSEPEDGYGEVFSALAPSGCDSCHSVV